MTTTPLPPVELPEVRLGGRNKLRPGDLVRVLPSQPGRRDGYIGRARRILLDHDEPVVEVTGGPAGRAKSVRTLRLARLARTQATEVTR